MASVSLETFNEQSDDYDTNQMGDEHVLDGLMVATVVQVAGQRAAITGE